MTRTEYMEKLQEKLDNFSRELREEILEDYKQHFAEGELQGKTDHEIIEELGNIEDMVRELSESELKENRDCLQLDLNGLTVSIQGNGKTTGTSGAEGDQSCGFENEGLTVSIQGNGKTTGTSGAEGDQGGGFENEGLTVSIQGNGKMAGTSGAEGGQGGSFENEGETGETWEPRSLFDYSGKYEKIVLDGKEADIYLKASKDEMIHVEYINDFKNGQMKYEYYQYEEKGIFYAGMKKRKEGWDCRTGVEGDEKSWRVMLFGKTLISYKNMGNVMTGPMLALCVSVPKGVAALSAKTSSGNVQVRELEQENMKLESSSGDIKVEKALANVMKLHSSSGDVTVCETKCCTCMDVGTSSGDVNIQKAVVAEGKAVCFSDGGQSEAAAGRRELLAHSSSGDVKVQDLTAEGVSVSSSSGDVSVQNVTAVMAGVKSSSGDVCVNNVNCSGELRVKNSSGDMALADMESESFNAESSGGDIVVSSITFTEGGAETSRGDLVMANMKFAAGEFSTASGDIVVSNFQFRKGKFSAREGDIVVSDLEFEEGNFATESGDITGSNLGGETGSFAASRGDIVLRDQNEKHCKRYQCTSEGGDINIESAAEIYECRAQSGDVSVQAFGNPKKLTLLSSNGDVVANAKGTPESVELWSKNGDVRLKLNEADGMDVNVNVGWGDGFVKWNGQKTNVKNGSYTFGNGACKVKVSSDRGDVSVSGCSDR